jgi:peptidoglycan/xylan/chitin deacetylase (PgdA/CDA1 family)
MRGIITRRLARYSDRVSRLLRPAQPMISFTFDDAYSKACTTAADMIMSANGRATYYVSGGFDRDKGGSPKFHNAREICRLWDAGHEIGCHGFYHLNYQSVPIEMVEKDIARNRAYFVEHGLPIPNNFAYPYGCVNRKVKRICSSHFISCRGVQNAINRRKVDLTLLKSTPLYSHRITNNHIDALISGLANEGGWLIFFSHDVTEDPGPNDCTPQLLAHALSAATSYGIPILTIGAALNFIKSGRLPA